MSQSQRKEHIRLAERVLIVCQRRHGETSNRTQLPPVEVNAQLVTRGGLFVSCARMLEGAGMLRGEFFRSGGRS